MGDSSNGEQLYYLRQRKSSINDYALRFCTLAVEIGWKECSVLTTYCQGLEPALWLHLFAYDDSIGLKYFIQLSIQIAHRVNNCMEDQQCQQSSYFHQHPELPCSPKPGSTLSMGPIWPQVGQLPTESICLQVLENSTTQIILGSPYGSGLGMERCENFIPRL